MSPNLRSDKSLSVSETTIINFSNHSTKKNSFCNPAFDVANK